MNVCIYVCMFVCRYVCTYVCMYTCVKFGALCPIARLSTILFHYLCRMCKLACSMSNCLSIHH